LPPPPTTPPPVVAELGAPSIERGSAPPTAADTTQTNGQDGNTVVPVIVVGLQSVHGYGHTHGHRHTDGRDEHSPPLPPPPVPPAHQQQQEDAGSDNDQALQDDAPGESADLSRNRERRWSSRAAEALRGLRPVSGPGSGSGSTRREGSGSTGTEGPPTRGSDDGHGSTTFFIYVIGGTKSSSPFAEIMLTVMSDLICAHLGRILSTDSPTRDRNGPTRLVRGAGRAPWASQAADCVQGGY
jgi:hypothetical protein